MSNDILQPIPDEDIPKLQEIYKKQLPRNTHIYNYLQSVIKWKKLRPDKNYITLLAPHGNWKNGTIVGIHKYNCYELFLSTLEEDWSILFEALIKTKLIEWNRSLLLYAVHMDHYSTVMKALKETKYRFYLSNVCDIWWMPHEKARNLEINCPPEVYVDKLNPTHAVLINSHWPHRYKDSHKYVATLIELNGGYGVFLKTDGTLVAWVLRNLIGLGALQTLDEHKRKGYGSLVTTVLAKEIAKEGLNPIGTVLQNNFGSQKMFGKLGFEILETVTFTENEEMRVNLCNGST
ncbi:hypothetical protein ILUMI_11981 [Ignelater luminosus]|uniref:N-acetyltransferase domain-containing protein n=1 Tax=Ignelater luminosus TaxID=2038154 RepID=A0A8K0CZD2_IGNLU|nr:hypothetical protein ILUMI_11981 [Ignelater luminosus]